MCQRLASKGSTRTQCAWPEPGRAVSITVHSTEAGKIDPSGARSSQPRNGLIAAASMKTAAAPASGRGMVAWEVS